MSRTVLTFLIAVVAAPVFVGAQESTIRHELVSAGFGAAVDVPGHPDLDRVLTSSDFTTKGELFAGAFYYADEATGTYRPSLRAALFDRGKRKWLVANLDNALQRKKLQTGFAVMAPQIAESHILFETHATPSAAFTIVLDRRLNLVTSIGGFDARVLRDGSIAFIANMIHFAPTHQESLWIWDPRSQRETEVFGEDDDTPLAQAYRRRVRDAYARLPEDDRKSFEDPYGPVNDFDRDFDHRQHSADGNRVAMIAAYTCDRLSWEYDDAMLTLVTCSRGRTNRWSCDEREIDPAARALSVTLDHDDRGLIAEASLDALTRTAVARR